VRTARGAADAWLGDAPPEVTSAVRSVVTEFVSNAVRYGRPPIELSLADDGDRIRIGVADAGTSRSSAHRDPGTPGRGLQIVAGLADRWGISDDRSSSWCELKSG
jgi:anti-sigma regulatory factor (Ser/Thr protein kinase)